MVSVVVFAGGVGSRFKSVDIPKQFVEVEGKPIIIHTLEKFCKHPMVDQITIACLDGWIDELRQQLVRYGITKVVSVVKGGSNGHESIHNGLMEVAKDYTSEDIVLICDDYQLYQ